MSAVPDVVEGEVAHELELAAPVPATLFRTDNPNEVIARATETANALARVVRDKNLATNIKGREHVRVEGWTLLGSMLGVFAVCTETRKSEDGWVARVEARTLSGAVVGAAEAECLRSENTWKSRDDYALLSMAQTRATSKALRQPLGFVMTLAGFDATPADEMPSERPQETFSAPADTKPRAATERGIEQGHIDKLNELHESLEKAMPSTLRTEDWATTITKWIKEQFPPAQSSANLNVAQANRLIEELDMWLIVESQKKAGV